MNWYQWIHEYQRINNASRKEAHDAYNRLVAWPKQCRVFRRQLSRWS